MTAAVSFGLMGALFSGFQSKSRPSQPFGALQPASRRGVQETGLYDRRRCHSPLVLVEYPAWLCWHRRELGFYDKATTFCRPDYTCGKLFYTGVPLCWGVSECQDPIPAFLIPRRSLWPPLHRRRLQKQVRLFTASPDGFE